MRQKLTKLRLDQLLVQRGLINSREQARRLILAGEVEVEGRIITKPGHQVPVTAELNVRQRPPYVSRGGLKLEAALRTFQIDVTGLIVVDLGAATGGFTDCLLQHGARRVYAVDVGYGQLAWKLRQDQRVVVMERVNARYLQLPEPVDLITADVSFISLELVLPAALRYLQPDGQLVVLIKPQFEAGYEQVRKGGVVRDRAVHRAVLHRFLHWAIEQGLVLRGLTPSPLRGPAGNVEFLAWLSRLGSSLDLETAIADCLGRLTLQGYT